MLVVELLALLLTLAALLVPPRLDHSTWGLFATLTVAGVLHTELVAGVERLRRYSADTHHVNLTSVWTFASALLLPAALGGLMVMVVYAHLYLRVQRPVPPPDRHPAYRLVYSGATVLLAVYATAGVLAATRQGEVYSGLPDALELPLALLTYTVVNTCLVLGVVAVASPDTRVVRILFGGDELTLELATLCLGALTAGALAASGPFVALLAVPPILALHRTILVRKLRERADTDSKTGLLNHAAWHLRGTHELTIAERERRPAALLILDLDHFKEINDTHGHLYGDQVLAATAGCCARSCATTTSSAGSAGRSSSCCSPGCPGTTVARRSGRSPSACAGGSRVSPTRRRRWTGSPHSGCPHHPRTPPGPTALRPGPGSPSRSAGRCSPTTATP
nr:GGDEF domain-containing protein [Pseudonocardia sp. ICBG601]